MEVCEELPVKVLAADAVEVSVVEHQEDLDERRVSLRAKNSDPPSWLYTELGKPGVSLPAQRLL